MNYSQNPYATPADAVIRDRPLTSDRVHMLFTSFGLTFVLPVAFTPLSVTILSLLIAQRLHRPAKLKRFVANLPFESRQQPSFVGGLTKLQYHLMRLLCLLATSHLPALTGTTVNLGLFLIYSCQSPLLELARSSSRIARAALITQTICFTLMEICSQPLPL